MEVFKFAAYPVGEIILEETQIVAKTNLQIG